MSEQPAPISPSLPPSAAPAAGSAASSADRARPPANKQANEGESLPHWLVRGELFLRVLLRMYIGLAICYVPWSRTFWDQNPLFDRFPYTVYLQNAAGLLHWAGISVSQGTTLLDGALRGIISGLGLLNLWIAFQDAVRHRDG